MVFMVKLQFSCGFPVVFMVKSPFSYGFPMVFMVKSPFSYGFPMVFMVKSPFSCGFPLVFTYHGARSTVRTAWRSARRRQKGRPCRATKPGSGDGSANITGRAWQVPHVCDCS